MATPAKEESAKILTLRPQKGGQERFLSSSADIVIFGGQAGSSKSFSLLLECTRHINVPKFGAVIFRRKLTQVTSEGGLWDESKGIYPLLGGRSRGEPHLDYKFPSGASIGFAHLIMEDTVFDWHSAQICLLCFDELTQFTLKQFFYMLTRNRSVCGVKPYVRGTCNPDADSWLAEFLSWWWDPETGYPIHERSGAIRWLVKFDEDFNWFDSYDEAKKWLKDGGHPADIDPFSVTFIKGSLDENKKLLEKDPGYKSKLYSQDRVTRERLLMGNWLIRATGGNLFKRGDFEIVDDYPRNWVKAVRYWDFAGTEVKRGNSKKLMAERMLNDPDWTCGLFAVIDREGTIYFIDLQRGRMTPGKVEKMVNETAKLDGKRITIWIEQEPGSSGKFVIHHYRTKVLLGYTVKSDRVSGSKLTRAEPYQAYAEAGNIKLVKGPWNKVFLDEHDAFITDGVHDDTVDVGSGAFKGLTERPPSVTEAMARRGKR